MMKYDTVYNIYIVLRIYMIYTTEAFLFKLHMFLHVPPFFDGPDMPLLPSWQLPCHSGFVSPQEAHNDFRREHGSCALQWSDECYQAAKRQANACQAKRCMFHATWHVRNIQEMPKLERSRLPFYFFFFVCVCVCVDLLKRCETCTCPFSAGGQSSLMLLCPTKLCIKNGSIHWPRMCAC